MLISRPRSNDGLDPAHVHNYYELLVSEMGLAANPRANQDPEFLADVSCVALNHLPPRYIRHDVDMNFFMSPIEREETQKKVKQAVDDAIEFVLSHERDKKQ